LVSKQTRKPFDEVPLPTRSLALISSDLAAPMKTRSLCGSLYFQLVIDRYSDIAIVYLLHDKNGKSVTENLKKGIALKERMSKEKEIKLLTDDGGEFRGNKLKSYFEEKGIQHIKTIPYTPQTNGAVERSNRTLIT
jgi:transposase InsO family protein